MWRFRKSFSPLPGVRLTLSPRGITTSVGVGPFRVSSGPGGQHFTANGLGTGLSYRTPLTGRGLASPRSAGQPRNLEPLHDPEPLHVPADPPGVQQIESAQAEVLTTPGIAEFRRLVDQARVQHAGVMADLAQVRSREKVAVDKFKKWDSGFVFKHLMKKRFALLRETAETASAERRELQKQEELAGVATEIEVPPGVQAAFGKFVDAFYALSRSNRIWDTVSERTVNQAVERSNADRAITRKQVRFAIGRCPVIKTAMDVPHLENANGGDIYLFPVFAVYFAGEKNYGLLEYSDVTFARQLAEFVETEAIPADSKVLGHTWFKTNKDGSQDRRFKDNFQIPVAGYASLIFRSRTGLNEEYLVSNRESAQRFEQEWQALVAAVKAGV